MHELEQHAVGIAMHDAFDRTVRVVADRIGRLARARLELRRIRHELARDRIVRIGSVNQRRHVGRQRHRIARGDPFELAKPLGGIRPAASSAAGSRNVVSVCRVMTTSSIREDVVSSAEEVQFFW